MRVSTIKSFMGGIYKWTLYWKCCRCSLARSLTLLLGGARDNECIDDTGLVKRLRRAENH